MYIFHYQGLGFLSKLHTFDEFEGRKIIEFISNFGISLIGLYFVAFLDKLDYFSYLVEYIEILSNLLLIFLDHIALTYN